MATWTWLTEPLPLDAANTRRWADGGDTDFLNDPADLAAWLDAARPRLPRHRFEVPASFDPHDLDTFRELRDLLISIFSPQSEGMVAPAAALKRLAEWCRSYPVVRILDEDGVAWAVPIGDDPHGRLVGLVAAETVSLVSTAADRVAVCHAPACHWLYLQARPNQRWCHPDCGNRARVSRHQRRRASARYQLVEQG